jgi:hypothetical protein
MLGIFIIIALITMGLVLFYDKKGSINEMERYYQTHPSFQKYLGKNKQSQKR